MKFLLISFVFASVVASLTAQITYNAAAAVQKNYKAAYDFLVKQENAVMDQVADIVVVSPAMRAQVVQNLQTSINKTFTGNYDELLNKAKIAVNTYLKAAQQKVTEFEKQINSTNAKFPKCSTFLNQARALQANFTNDVQCCVNSTIEAVARVARLKIVSSILDIAKRFVEDVNQNYLLCRGNPTTNTCNPDGSCIVNLSKIQTVNPMRLSSFMQDAVYNARLSMARALNTGRTCLRGKALAGRAEAQKLRTSYQNCLRGK